ncbi:phage-like protein [Staphylococcus aureus]|nr:phage-like protein [Staphylococcus aureus]
MKELNIVGMSFYLTTADTNRLAGFPNSRKNVAGWNLKILASNTGGFIHQLIRNSISAPTEMLLKNYDSPSESGPWTLLRGEIIN